MTYAADWKEHIKPLITGVKQNKVTAKGLQGMAKDSSKIETALKAVDEALEKGGEAIKKAYQGYVAATLHYGVHINTAGREIAAATDGSLDAYSSIVMMTQPNFESWRKEIKIEMAKALKEGEMKPTYYYADWKSAKQNFEAVTKKKKPSAGFLGPFRKSAGIDKCVKAIDAATLASDLAALKKAVKALEPSAESYIKVLKAAAKKEPEESQMQKETLGLEGTLTAVLQRALSTLKEAEGN